ncbi:MAG: hypothetical protein C4326_00995 [Ignavibacteria bacterium]
MKQKLLITLAGMLVLLLGGQLSSRIQRASLQREVDRLKQQGLTYKVPNNDLVEVKQEWIGLSQVFFLREPSEQQIRTWAQARGIPILEIDPNAIDTSRFTGWYRYWTTVPVSNGFGQPLLVGDIDRNGKPEVYGDFKSYTSDFESHIYEVDSNGTATLLHSYIPRRGASIQFVDVDRELSYGSCLGIR